jgi:hypothetical protein
MLRKVLALGAAAAIAVAHPINVTCTPSANRFEPVSVVAVFHSIACKLGSAAGDWMYYPCPTCDNGCLRCADGNVVALGEGCRAPARTGELADVTGWAEFMVVDENVVGLTLTMCSVLRPHAWAMS